MNDEIKPIHFALDVTHSILQSSEDKKPPRHKMGDKFLKGPIPLKWLSKAAYLRGKSLHCAIAVYFLAGIKNERTFPLESFAIKAFGIKRHSLYRGLKALENEKLISAIRHPGRYPIVTILEVD